MKKTYIITMPNHIGAFHSASQIFLKNDVNITRVSYNKALDEHTLFLDVEGKSTALKKCDKQLDEIGYLRTEYKKANVYMTEFSLENKPGAVTPVLALIQKYSFNISYMSYAESNDEFQKFKMGLYVDDFVRFNEFIIAAQKICEVKVLQYSPNGQVFDNSVFYTSFVSGLAQTMQSDEETKNKLLINANMAMQILDETGQSPYQAFDSISKFAELLAICRGDNFKPRITRFDVSEKVSCITIEPDCGSNTTILISENDCLFIDCGYALYRNEMKKLLNELIGFDKINKKKILITHPDLDHIGILDEFDEIIASHNAKQSISLEFEGKDGFREMNPLHSPYIHICKCLTNYKPVNPKFIITPFRKISNQNTPLEQIGFFDFEDMHFEVYEGIGGHVKGEIVLIDYSNNIAITGDIYVNLKEMTQAQKKYNTYAPILMTSVDTDPALAAQERKAIFQRLGQGEWKVIGAHGAFLNYSLKNN